MIPVLCLDDSARLALFKRHRGVFKRLYHHAYREVSEVAALFRGTGVVGIFGRERRKILAFFNPAQELLCLFLCLILIVFMAYEYMSGLYLSRLAEFVHIPFITRLEFRVRHLYSLRKNLLAHIGVKGVYLGRKHEPFDILPVVGAYLLVFHGCRAQELRGLHLNVIERYLPVLLQIHLLGLCLGNTYVL